MPVAGKAHAIRQPRRRLPGVVGEEDGSWAGPADVWSTRIASVPTNCSLWSIACGTVGKSGRRDGLAGASGTVLGVGRTRFSPGSPGGVARRAALA